MWTNDEDFMTLSAEDYADYMMGLDEYPEDDDFYLTEGNISIPPLFNDIY